MNASTVRRALVAHKAAREVGRIRGNATARLVRLMPEWAGMSLCGAPCQTEGESLIGAYRCLARLGARYLRELDSLVREGGR